MRDEVEKVGRARTGTLIHETYYYRLPSGRPRAVTVGADLASGEVPQHVIPAGHWQSARPAGATEVLVSCVVAPGFDFADFTLLPG